MLEKLYAKAVLAKMQLTRALFEERGEVNVVATVLLIAVAVGLVLLFKEEVGDLIKNVFKNLDVSNLSSKP